MSVFEDQKKFMIACGQHVDVKVCGMFPISADDPVLKQTVLYAELIDEETTELRCSRSVVDMADSIIDSIVVLVGMGYSAGLPMQALWDEVIRSNMSKVMPDGKVHRREDGKVLKPDTFSPADIRGVLKQHGFDV